MHLRTTRSLLDIVEACDELDLIVHDVSLEMYRRTRLVQLGIERLFITIAEALKRAEENDADLVARLPDARNIIGMRNRIVHGYDTVDLETVWTAAVKHAPILRKQILELIQQDETRDVDELDTREE